VHEVTPPAGEFDDGSLDYDLEHPPSCQQEADIRYGEDSPLLTYTCGVAQAEDEAGLAGALRYSGTPVTEPGTYRIQAWSRVIRGFDWTEHDASVGVMDPAVPDA